MRYRPQEKTSSQIIFTTGQFWKKKEKIWKKYVQRFWGQVGLVRFPTNIYFLIFILCKSVGHESPDLSWNHFTFQSLSINKKTCLTNQRLTSRWNFQGVNCSFHVVFEKEKWAFVFIFLLATIPCILRLHYSSVWSMWLDVIRTRGVHCVVRKSHSFLLLLVFV